MSAHHPSIPPGDANIMDVNTLYLANALEHKDIINKLADVTETVDRIERQTSATNGRVSALEKIKWLTAGALLVIIPVLVFLINTILYNSGVIKKFEQLHSRELSPTPNTQEIRK